MSGRVAMVVGLLLATGCGNAAPPPAEPTAAAPTKAPSPEPESTPEPSDPPSEASAPAATPDLAPRDVRYVMTPAGLVIEISGARFTPKAKAVRVGGGWGVRLEVEASVEDTALSLLAPDGEPLAIAAQMIRAGDTTRFSDTRRGDKERFLSPGQSHKLVREFPGKTGEKPLKKGERLVLQVGLWGLGPDEKSRRPVKKLFVVAMEVGSKTPQPVISPPEQP